MTGTRPPAGLWLRKINKFLFDARQIECYQEREKEKKEYYTGSYNVGSVIMFLEGRGALMSVAHKRPLTCSRGGPACGGVGCYLLFIS